MSDVCAGVFAKRGVVPEDVVALAKASKRKNRQRNNILWYNPPFSINAAS